MKLCSIPHRNLWAIGRLTDAEVLALLDTAGQLKQRARAASPAPPLRGMQIALLRKGPSAQGEDALRRAALDLGAQVAQLQSIEGADNEAVLASARLLGKLYDAVDCDGVPPQLLAQLDRAAGVPVFDGLAADSHPTRVLGDLLTIQGHSDKPVSSLKVCFVGDPRTPCAQAFARFAALLGIAVHALPPNAAASSTVDFVIEAAGDTPWTLRDGNGPVGNNEQANSRRFTLQALLSQALT